MSKRAWLVFLIIQIVGCLPLAYWTYCRAPFACGDYSESAFTRGTWVAGSLLLLPGAYPAIVLRETSGDYRPPYAFIPTAVICNAALWLTWTGIWRALRRDGAKVNPYLFATANALLLFVTVNTLHFLQPVDCVDCFYPYGVPFTVYRDSGYGGGAGFVWSGIAANAAVVLVVSGVLGRMWQVVNTKLSR